MKEVNPYWKVRDKIDDSALESIKLALRAVMNAHPWPANDDQALAKLTHVMLVLASGYTYTCDTDLDSSMQ